MDYITEWWAPNFHNEAMRPFELLLLATFAAAALARPREREPRFGDVLILAATAHAAFLSQRNTAPFALVAAPILAGAASTLLRDVSAPGVRELTSHPAIRTAGAMLLAAGLFFVGFEYLPRREDKKQGRAVERLVPPSEWFAYGVNLEGFPRAAVAQMEQGMWPGRLYNDYVWGGYLIWKLHPDRKVFIDGRAEVYYATKTFDDEMAIHNTTRGWQQVLDRRGVEVILTHANGTLAARLAQEPAWQLGFRGPVEVVYTRRVPLPGQAVQ
jgi:hypothetical protein